MKKLLLFLFASLIMLAQPLAATSAAQRVYNVPHRPIYRLLAKQFASNANVFTLVDPSPAGTPLTLTSATGISGPDGSATIEFGAGFTAPINAIAYIWQRDIVNPSNSHWTRLGANSGQYQISVDTNYAIVTIAIPEYTEFLIMTSAAVTGNVYTDAAASVSNPNSATGYPQ